MLGTPHPVEEAAGNDLVERDFLRSDATVLTASRYRVSQLLRRAHCLSDLQAQARTSISRVHRERFPVRGWQTDAGEDGRALEDSLVAPAAEECEAVHCDRES